MLAIVPVNSPSSAKSRLEPLLSAAERAELVRVMLADVLAACRKARSIGRIFVVTPEPTLVPAGAEGLIDPGLGHASALSTALHHSRGNRGAFVVMGDCPLVTPDGIDALVAAARRVALCPAQDGGINAIVLRPAKVLEPAFGVQNGAEITIERARELGVPLAVVEDPLVALDVDTPEDVRRVLELGHGTMTHRFLDRVLAAPAELPGRGG